MGSCNACDSTDISCPSFNRTLNRNVRDNRICPNVNVYNDNRKVTVALGGRRNMHTNLT